MTTSASATNPAPARVVLTDRDRMLFTLASQKPSSVEDLAVATNSSIPAVRNRLSALARAGFMTDVKLPGEPLKFWLPTSAGYKARLPLPADSTPTPANPAPLGEPS